MKLTIGIPTYNRGQKVVALLRFLDNEIKTIDKPNEIEIVVNDNCSTDNTFDLLLELQRSRTLSYEFTLNRNFKNEGIIGNQVILHEIANGEYIWVMGDDDIYHKGIVRRVLDEIESGNYSFIFINHCQYKASKDDGTLIPSMLEGIDLSRDPKNILLDITDKYGLCLMYISATIHKTCFAKIIKENNFEVNLAYPLLLSYISATKGNIKLIEEVLIDDVTGEISWSNLVRQVHEIDVPYVLRQLEILGYDNWRKTYINYFEQKGYAYSWKSFIKICLRKPKYFISSIIRNRYRFKNFI